MSLPRGFSGLPRLMILEAKLQQMEMKMVQGKQAG